MQGIGWGFCFIWSSTGEGAACQLTWLLVASSSLHCCWIEGLSFLVAVRRRLPSAHCHLRSPLQWWLTTWQLASKGKSLLVIGNMTRRLNHFNLLHLIEVNCMVQGVMWIQTNLFVALSKETVWTIKSATTYHLAFIRPEWPPKQKFTLWRVNQFHCHTLSHAAFPPSV